MAMVFKAVLVSAVFFGALSDDDVGYDLLYKTANEEFDSRCVKVTGKPFPDWFDGDFIIGSVGQQEMGDRHFVGYLDAFGKYNKYSAKAGQVCATYRMMRTGFYNNSVEAGTIAPDLLFYETEPPRSCPLLEPVCNLPPFAPNDNTFVNTFKHNGDLLSVTDAPYMLKLDPETLNVTGTMEWDDNVASKFAVIGSAHPEMNFKFGEYLDYAGNENLLTGHVDIVLYGMSDKNPTTRQARGIAKMSSVPYIHSFGVTDNYVILPRMPVKFGLPLGKPMSAAFTDIAISEPGPDNAFHVVPLDGGETIVRFLPVEDKLYYTHTVNSYENETGLVIDLATLSSNPFQGDLTTKDELNKTFRDSCYHDEKPCVNLIRRFHIPLKKDGLVTTEIVSDPTVKTDFTRMNGKKKGKKHCFYWGVEWFTDKKSKASMGIAKYDLCGTAAATKKVWSRKNWYPSEAIFVSNSKPDAAEDDGIVLFTALEGANSSTWFMAVNASTMELHSQAGPFPRVAFTTHAEFYPSVTAAVYV